MWHLISCPNVAFNTYYIVQRLHTCIAKWVVMICIMKIFEIRVQGVKKWTTRESSIFKEFIVLMKFNFNCTMQRLPSYSMRFGSRVFSANRIQFEFSYRSQYLIFCNIRYHSNASYLFLILIKPFTT